MVFVYTLTIFLSAALLFMLQPMIGKMILPSLGGSPAVWNTCLVFFQTILLSGYLYAHFSIKWLGHKLQPILHILLMVSTVIWLSLRWIENRGTPFQIETDKRVFTDTAADPTMQLLVLLVTLVGLPFFVISASAPILQSWFSKTKHTNAANPFFLYAASNLGSMLSLIAYPFLMNKYFTLTQQGQIWTFCFTILMFGFVFCTILMRKQFAPPLELTISEEKAAPPSLRDVFVWIGLAFVPSSLLTGETTFLAMEVLSHPLLWVITLALYLLTFIVVFADKPWITHENALRWTPFSVILLTIVVAGKTSEPTWLIVGVHLVSFFLLTLVAHGELAKRRPSARNLTSYYLWMSCGGVLGGAFNSLLSPVIFKQFGLVEYPIGLIGSFVILGLASGSFRKPIDWLYASGLAAITVVLFFLLPRGEAIVSNFIFGVPALMLLPVARNLPRFALGASVLIIIGALDPGVNGTTLFLERNFYGVLKVTFDPQRNANLIIHGNTLHSLQSREPSEALIPTAYYYPDGPMSHVFREAEAKGFKNICVAGLGAGGIACYAKPGQHWTFYEIDPTMQRVAENPSYFTFLKECFPNGGPTYEVQLGDARLAMTAEPDAKFDLIVLNAFSSSSPPLHLLTDEAATVYLSKLAAGGLLVYNASNRHLELERALAAIANSRGVFFRNAKDFIKTTEEKRRGKMNCSFVVMAREESQLNSLRTEEGWTGPPENLPKVWTDQYSDILGSMKWER